MNEPSSEANSDKLSVDAICVYCNKRFTSMHSISMHLKETANRHAVNFVNRGKYDKKTGTIRKNSDYFNFVAKIGMPLFTSILSPDIKRRRTL
ncbi:MAG: hypothetical protein WA364_04095 [Candidatus Nitrosopolaris sp.]